MTEISENIKQLSQLKYFELRGSLLTQLPETFTKLSLLEALYLDGNSILKSLPKNIGNCENIHTFSSSLNFDLEQLPESFTQLHQLKYVYVEYLKELPKNIGQLKNLKELHLWNNDFGQLPEELCELTELEVLDLHANKLSTLPNCINQLQKLQVLTLEDDALKKLPKELKR